jgi:heat-inducible transcriptional repressor
MVGVRLAFPHTFEDHFAASPRLDVRMVYKASAACKRPSAVVGARDHREGTDAARKMVPIRRVIAMGSADERRFEVLRAIVADFVATKEPIGSKALVERHNLGVSSATVRNDMAVLEAEGYIAQPHTSSGRVPTEKGYREFVDRLDGVKPLSAAERRAIQKFLESGVDLDDVLRRAVRLLAQLTRQVAVVQYPTLSTSTVRHLEVIALTPARLLMVVITDTGRVDQRIVELGDVIDDHQLSQLRDMLCHALEGKKLTAASAAVAELAEGLEGAGGLGDAIGRAATVLVESLVEHNEERLVMGGTANLTRNTADFGGSLRSILEALEEQVVVLRLLAAQQEAGKVTVRIGHENEAEEMAAASVVSTAYGTQDTIYGGMGVLGPTRMDYPGTIASVAAVAMYIGEVLGAR